MEWESRLKFETPIRRTSREREGNWVYKSRVKGRGLGWSSKIGSHRAKKTTRLGNSTMGQRRDQSEPSAL